MSIECLASLTSSGQRKIGTNAFFLPKIHTIILVKHVQALLSKEFHTIFDFKLSGPMKIPVILTKIKTIY